MQTQVFYRVVSKSYIDNPDWAVESGLADVVFGSTKKVSRSSGKLTHFYSMAFSLVKPSIVSSAPKSIGPSLLKN